MTLATDQLAIRLGCRPALTDVTLTLAPGELTAILGANGAGKSTLLRALAGLLHPSAGRVLLDGQPLTDVPAPARARRIGYLPQSRIVHWPLSVARTVALGRVPHGDQDQGTITRAMAEMDVSRFADRAVTELSGGELARVLMARVLAQDTAVLLADEPTAGLDPAHQLALLDRLASLTRAGRTVAVALHDLTLAARYCDRILLLHEGRLIAQGTPSVVLTPANLRAAFSIDARLATVDGFAVVLPVRL
jgi:iron complex transport system ATP-binding protein